MTNPDSIPRYEPPAWEDEDPTPGELLRRCIHRGACLMWNDTFEGDDETLGRVLCCADCTEWDE